MVGEEEDDVADDEDDEEEEVEEEEKGLEKGCVRNVSRRHLFCLKISAGIC